MNPVKILGAAFDSGYSSVTSRQIPKCMYPKLSYKNIQAKNIILPFRIKVMKHSVALQHNSSLFFSYCNSIHTLHSQYAFEWKQQGSKYFPTGSPPFGTCFLPVSGCQTLWPHILLFVMWCYFLFSCSHMHVYIYAILAGRQLIRQICHEWISLLCKFTQFSVSLVNRGVFRQCLHGREKSMASPPWPSRFWRKPTSVVVLVWLPPSSLPATIPCCSTYRLENLSAVQWFICHIWVNIPLSFTASLLHLFLQSLNFMFWNLILYLYMCVGSVKNPNLYVEEFLCSYFMCKEDLLYLSKHFSQTGTDWKWICFTASWNGKVVTCKIFSISFW